VFGENIGQALKGLGTVTEQAGNEMVNRALALQELKNETQAKEADAQYMIAVGQKHAEFSSLQGKAAADAYPKYMQDMQDLRKQYRDALPNDAARRMYDSSSLSTMGRTIFNGAGHAATQNKVWAANSSKARVDGVLQSILANPKDDVGYQSGIRSLLSEVDAQADLGGWGKDQIDHEKAEKISLALAHRIVGLSKTDPIKANQLLEANRDKIFYQHVESAQSKVQHELHTTGARVYADAVNAGWAPYMTPDAVDRAAGVDSTLLRIVKEAQKDPSVRFTIPAEGGRRTQQEQNAIVARGASQTFNSEHLYGKAIDLAPLDANGKPDFNDKAGYAKIEKAMTAAAERLGIPLAQYSERFKSWDPGHYGLPHEYDVRGAPKAVEEPLASRVDRAVAEARRAAPNDTTFHDYVRDRVETQFAKDKAIKRDEDFTNLNTINGALVGNFGKIPSTVEELKATDPRVAAAFDRLDETQQRKVLKDLGRTRAQKDDLAVYQKLTGMAHDDPAAFTDHDVIGEGSLTDASKKHFINLQQKLKANAQSDPRVTKALQILGPDLNAAGIRRTDKDRYFQFVGALQDQLEDFQTAHKRSPKPEEVRALGAQLMQQQTIPGSIFGSLWPNHPATFELEVPTKDAEAIKSDPTWTLMGIEPTDEQVRRIYVRRKFLELYGGKATKPTEPKEPGVPEGR
jgi:peptidoglycan L-alanyl-D-glutamate endopeptidase CwlK